MKLIRKLIALGLVIGLVSSAAVENTFSVDSSVAENRPPGFGRAHDYTVTYVDDDESNNYMLIPESTSLITDTLNVLVGYKSAALSLAVKSIGWLVKNVVVVIIGAIVALGFCKLTGKCSLDYEHFEHVEQFRSLVTPERLAKAQRFLVTAVEKYAKGTKKGRPVKKAHSKL